MQNDVLFKQYVTFYILYTLNIPSVFIAPVIVLFYPPMQYSPACQVKENKEKERLERRLLDELYKIFMDSDSFYYSMTYDLTNSVQRQGDQDKSNVPLWKQVCGRTHQ